MSLGYTTPAQGEYTHQDFNEMLQLINNSKVWFLFSHKISIFDLFKRIIIDYVEIVVATDFTTIQGESGSNNTI